MNPILNILIINVQIATHFKCVTVYMVKVSINLRENVVQKNLREISGITLIKKEFLKNGLEREKGSPRARRRRPAGSAWAWVLDEGLWSNYKKKRIFKTKVHFNFLSILKFGKLDTKLQPHNTYNLIII